MNKEIILETKNYIKELKIAGIRNDLNEKIAEAYRNNIPYEELLRDLFLEAYDMRKENGRKNRIKNAKFPYKKYLDTLIVDYLPESAQAKFKELKSLKFIEENRNIIFSGNPGTGKSHLLLSIGIEACRQGKTVGFFTAAGLCNQLIEMQEEQRLLDQQKKNKKSPIILTAEGVFSSPSLF